MVSGPNWIDHLPVRVGVNIKTYWTIPSSYPPGNYCNISTPAIKRHEGLAVRCWEGSISGWAWIIVPPIGVRSWKKSRWWWRKSFYIGIMVNSKHSLKPHFKCQEVAYPRKVFLIFQEGVNTKSRDIQLIHGYVSHMLGKMLPKRQWIVLRNLKHKRDSPYV